MIGEELKILYQKGPKNQEKKKERKKEIIIYPKLQPKSSISLIDLILGVLTRSKL